MFFFSDVFLVTRFDFLAMFLFFCKYISFVSCLLRIYGELCFFSINFFRDSFLFSRYTCFMFFSIFVYILDHLDVFVLFTIIFFIVNVHGC